MYSKSTSGVVFSLYILVLAFYPLADVRAAPGDSLRMSTKMPKEELQEPYNGSTGGQGSPGTSPYDRIAKQPASPPMPPAPISRAKQPVGGNNKIPARKAGPAPANPGKNVVKPLPSPKATATRGQIIQQAKKSLKNIKIPVRKTFFGTRRGQFNVEMDRVDIMELPVPAHQIIIGNPAIADASILSENRLVITGKSYGSTRIIVIDKNERTIVNQILMVSNPRDNRMLTLSKGFESSSYHCSPRCRPTPVLSDQQFKKAASMTRERDSFVRTMSRTKK
jgi:hypothetical protein